MDSREVEKGREREREKPERHLPKPLPSSPLRTAGVLRGKESVCPWEGDEVSGGKYQIHW